MKKFFLIIFAVVMIPSASCAAPAYGTRMPAKGRLFTGVETYSVLERKLEGVHGEMASLQHFLLASFGVTDWLSVDLKAGTGNIRTYPDAGEKITYSTYFAGGYGFRVRVYEKGRVKAVCGFQHISVHPYSETVGVDKYEAILDDWQGSALVSYGFEKVTPYAGLKAGRMDYTYWVNDDDRNRVKGDETKMIGLLLGMDVALNQKAWVNLEAQFLECAAVTAGVHWEF